MNLNLKLTPKGLRPTFIHVNVPTLTFNNCELVIDDLSQRGQAVGGARGVGHNLHAWAVLVLVDTHDKHWRIGRRGRDNDFFGST